MTKNCTKVEGVFTDITRISESIKRLIRQYDEDNFPLSHLTAEVVVSSNLDQLPPSYMYTQLIKEIILDMEYPESSVTDLTTYRYQLFDKKLFSAESIAEFEQHYTSDSANWWHTSWYFIYSTLNKALRNFNTYVLVKMAFFIRDLYRQLEYLYVQQFNAGGTSQIFTVYRGQDLSSEDFENASKTKDGPLSFDYFLSTSSDRDISSVFAVCISDSTKLIPILFDITVDPSK